MGRRQKRVFEKKFKLTYLTIVEGYTEQWYLKGLQFYLAELGLNREISINIVNLKKSLESIDYLDFDDWKFYHKVFVIVDLDAVLNKGLCEQFLRLKSKIEKYANATVLVNNPCFEYFLLLHFKFLKPNVFNCDSLIKQYLSKQSEFKNYSKTKAFYNPDKPKINLFERLLDRLPEAIKRARQTGRFDKDFCKNPKPIAEIYIAIEEILNKIEEMKQ